MLECVLQQSAERNRFVEVSLKSGKSYIGLVRESGISRRQSEPDIALIPMASGYRHRETRELRITTDYSGRIFEFLNAPARFPGLSYEDFRVVFPMSEITSARMFDPAIFELFRERADAPADRRDGPPDARERGTNRAR